jgi:membrane protease YdiL (CAAX protease family)
LQHFYQRLRQTPLLLGWMLIGPLVALVIEGTSGLVLGLVNLILLGIYAVLIRYMTSRPAAPAPVKRPRLELGTALGLLTLLLVVQFFHFGVWTLQPWHGWVVNFFQGLQRTMAGLPGIPDWAAQSVYLAASSTMIQLLPTLLAFLLLGYGLRSMGLDHPNWKLTAVLMGVTAAFGLFTGVLLAAPVEQVLGLYLIGIFVNALPEELFFRSFLLPRLEEAFANPLNALVVSALVFNLIHVPIEIYRGASPLMALLSVFSIGYPTGLIWGYLYQRTRSILPGTLWHAANARLGFLFVSM